MTPRVFISSTYYDLKHVRERLEQFIESYGFEPVLFESDKVTYDLEKPIDKSAYYEVTLCHIMVLIIGGRYGTPASQQEDNGERQKIYEDEFVSITRRELETAVQNNIPIFIFIDKNVHSEYYTYRENKDFLAELKKTSRKEFKFAHADSINIFRFIELVSNKPIKTFEKVEEIEKYLTNQFAGLFYLHLESLKKKSNDKKILDSVNELNSISLRMNEMLNSVGEKILGKENDQYLTVIQNQLKILIDYFIEQLYANIFAEKIDLEQDLNINFDEVFEVFMDVIEDDYNSPNNISLSEYASLRQEYRQKTIFYLENKLKEIHPELLIQNIDIFTLQSIYKFKVKPFLITDDDRLNFKNAMTSALSSLFGDLPF